MKSTPVTRLLLVLLSLAFTLGLAEVAVRLRSALTGRLPLLVADDRTGWALRPGLRDRLKVEDRGQFRTSTDAEGHRLTVPADAPASLMRPALLLVGDSFVLGVGVDDEETFGWILAHELPLQVVNLGVPAYGTDQELLALEACLEAHPELEVRDIVVFVFDNDFTDVQLATDRTLRRSKPRFRIGDAGLEQEPFRVSLFDRLTEASVLYGVLHGPPTRDALSQAPEAAAGVDLLVACLQAMRAAATRRGARLHVLAHHRLTGPVPFAASVWEDFLRRAEATDITERLRAGGGPDPIGYDGAHWSAEGHRRVARIVKELLEDPARLSAPAARAHEADPVHTGDLK